MNETMIGVKISRLAVVGVLLLSFVAVAQAQKTVGWRTDGTGRYPDAQPVAAWGTTQNVVWATQMPSWGNASPVVVDDRIFVCSEPDELICVNRVNGAIQWRRSVKLSDVWTDEDRAGAAEKQKLSDELKKEYQRLDDAINDTWDKKSKDPTNQALKDQYKTLRTTQAKVLSDIGQLALWAPAKTESSNGYTSATPVSDGKHVWVLMGTGVAACFDLDGTRKWVKFIDKPKHQEGHAASPVLCQGKLLLQVKNLCAHDPLTGERIWENIECPRTWGTPFPTQVGGIAVVITARGKVVRVADGQMLAADAGKLEYASPLVVDGVVYMIENGGQATQLLPGPEGTITTNKLWTTQPEKDRYYASPLLHDGLLYTMHQNNGFCAIDAKTGIVIKAEKLMLGKGEAYMSITLAGGLLFAANESGMMAVIQPGRDFQVLGINTLDGFRATPVFEGRRMYLRTRKFLYCIGAP